MKAPGQLPSLPPLKPGPDEKCTVTVSYSVNMQHEALVMKSSVLYNTAPVNKAQNILVSCICIQSLYISDSPLATPLFSPIYHSRHPQLPIFQSRFKTYLFTNFVLTVAPDSCRFF